MAEIKLLSEETIDKIAAGEVVDRPAGVVKELLENSIDAGAKAITVEIKDGGISFIRISDNGDGIPSDQIATAFLRHATSKISTIEDLLKVRSLGFRGEALSSIAAVSMVEVITHYREETIGTRYVIEGSREVSREAVGVPPGTTIVVKNLFYNTPARRKFLKSASTEGSYVNTVVEHIALSHPDISIKFINGGNIRFQTSGRNDLKEVIYSIYGRDIASGLIPLSMERKGIVLRGMLGKPEIVRSTRNYETFFVNGRFVKSSLLSHALEDGYREYLMQHKFPFAVLDIIIHPEEVDVNVHPAKMEIRFSDEQEISGLLSAAVAGSLRMQEMIPEVGLSDESPVSKREKEILPAPEPFEKERLAAAAKVLKDEPQEYGSPDYDKVLDRLIGGVDPRDRKEHNIIKARDAIIVNKGIQMELFDRDEPKDNERLLSPESVEQYNIIGQLFATYWLIEYKDKLLVLDQHAAHEKVKYESLIAGMRRSEAASQLIAPPIAVTLNPAEYELYRTHSDSFRAIGYRMEEFGTEDIAIRGVPTELLGSDPKDLFLEILDGLGEYRNQAPATVTDRLAGLACKSAVKGGDIMNPDEVKSLLKQMLSLENPYNCPHGRPTLITITRAELEKKFKRIV